MTTETAHPTKQDERRKHRRFTDRSLARAEVCLVPCPPLYGEAATGCVMDLSAGGMALYLPEMLPKDVFLKMTMVMPDGSAVESVVKVRRVSPQGASGYYLHGIEFLNPSPETIERIDAMAEACLACDKRIEQRAEEICVAGCPYASLCSRPERRAVHEQPMILHLDTTADVPEQSSWSKFKASFADRMKDAA